MRNVSGGNAAETRMIKAVQKAVGAIPDGSIGAQTMSDIAVKLGADCFPLGISIYGQPCIIAPDIIPISARGPLENYSQAISGSFNDGGAPCSILVANSFIVCSTSCHYWDDKSPESVIYRDLTGQFGMVRAQTVADLPDGLSWAVGGMGLLGCYNPAKEGFKGRFSDVLRKTNHTMLGVKNGMVYMVYCTNMTATQVNNFASKLGLEMAIMLDGGHLAAINSESTQINCGQRQLYVIQAVSKR